MTKKEKEALDEALKNEFLDTDEEQMRKVLRKDFPTNIRS